MIFQTCIFGFHVNLPGCSYQHTKPCQPPKPSPPAISQSRLWCPTLCAPSRRPPRDFPGKRPETLGFLLGQPKRGAPRNGEARWIPRLVPAAKVRIEPSAVSIAKPKNATTQQWSTEMEPSLEQKYTDPLCHSKTLLPHSHSQALAADFVVQNGKIHIKTIWMGINPSMPSPSQKSGRVKG